MKYRFSDINNDGMYETARVMFITGPYSLFNNIVSDRLRTMCKGTLDTTTGNEDLMAEFNMSSFDSDTVANSIDFQTFLDVVKMPAVTGKWFCSVDYKMLTKKQRETLERYMKKPNANGVLVITMLEYQDYKTFVRNRAITAHQYTHIIQLSFPYRNILKEIIKKMINDRGVTVADKAVELFLLRMSSNYDEYEQVLDSVCKHRKGTEMTYKDMVESMKGIENYVLDDFLQQLVVPIKSRKIATNRKIYKMLDALVSDVGARDLVMKIRYKIDDLIEMRIAINRGLIPIRIGFSVTEAKDRLEEDNKLKKLNDYTFRRYAELASKTSLRDWVFMKMILSNVKQVWNSNEFERVLHCLIHRSLLSTSRLTNDIGISNIIEEQLYDVNSIFFRLK